MADYNKSGTLPISVVFTASIDTQNPLTSHIWKVDGVTDTTVGSTFVKIFTAYKDAYSIEHSGSNACGSNCTPVTKTISITATPQQGIPIEVILASIIGVGVIGYLWLMRTPKNK